jgi:hypothetical protein
LDTLSSLETTRKKWTQQFHGYLERALSQNDSAGDLRKWRRLNQPLEALAIDWSQCGEDDVGDEHDLSYKIENDETRKGLAPQKFRC